jgi:hypothetical protein
MIIFLSHFWTTFEMSAIYEASGSVVKFDSRIKRTIISNINQVRFSKSRETYDQGSIL